jgi:hypothetical protein
MRITLKNLIVPSIPLAVLMVSFCFGLWAFAYFASTPTTLDTYMTVVAENIQSLVSNNKFFLNGISIVITLLNAFLIAQMNNRFTIIRTRTFLPIFVFLLLVCSWNETHAFIAAHISLTFFILALFNFFSMEKNQNASEQAFMGSFFISLAGILINPYLLLIPVSWIGFIIFQSFSLRTFLASVFGTLVPWIFFFVIEYSLQNKLNLPELFVSNFNFNLSFSTFSITRLIYTGLIAIILIISLFGLRSISNSDALSTRNKLNFLILLFVAVLLLSIFSRNQLSAFLLPLALIFSLLVSHPFTLKQNTFYSIVFILLIAINIAFIFLKHLQI